MVSTAGTLFDTVLIVNSDACGTELLCNDDVSTSDTTSWIDLNAVQGQSYYIVVGGYASSNGAFSLTISY